MKGLFLLLESFSTFSARQSNILKPMDPFTLTTGVVTLLGLCMATAKIFKKIRSLKEAPELIQALNNELSDLQLVIASVDSHLKSSTQPELCHIEEDHFLLCSKILEDTQQTVIELENFLRKNILKPNANQVAVLEINHVAFLKRAWPTSQAANAASTCETTHYELIQFPWIESCYQGRGFVERCPFQCQGNQIKYAARSFRTQ